MYRERNGFRFSSERPAQKSALADDGAHFNIYYLILLQRSSYSICKYTELCTKASE